MYIMHKSKKNEMSRMYETNSFQNTVRLAVESLKLNYVIGSSFVIRTEDREDEDERNSPSVSLISSLVSGKLI